jgi:hypothetical protein
VDRRVAAAVLGFVAAAMLLPALFTRGWWTGEKRESDGYGGSGYGGKVVATLAVGVFGVEFCNRDYDSEGMECKSFSFGEVPGRGPFGTWRTLGKGVVAGGLATAAAMVVLGVFALQRKRLPIGVFAGPALGGAAFLILWLAWNQSLGGGENAMEISPGFSFFLALVGYGAATAAIWLFAGLPAVPAAAPGAQPVAQAVAPMAQLPPLGAQQAHPCPRCHAPLTFVAQYNRWYCNACQQYS